jgi:hypothetical protein
LHQNRSFFPIFTSKSAKTHQLYIKIHHFTIKILHFEQFLYQNRPKTTIFRPLLTQNRPKTPKIPLKTPQNRSLSHHQRFRRRQNPHESRIRNQRHERRFVPRAMRGDKPGELRMAVAQRVAVAGWQLIKKSWRTHRERCFKKKMGAIEGV